MSPRIIPLRSKDGDRAALARIDGAAVALLSGGRAVSLEAARAEVILTDLRLRRNEMSTLLSDLRCWESTRDIQIDDANANLIAAIVQGLVQIDLFIAEARCLLDMTELAGATQPDASRQASKSV